MELLLYIEQSFKSENWGFKHSFKLWAYLDWMRLIPIYKQCTKIYNIGTCFHANGIFCTRLWEQNNNMRNYGKRNQKTAGEKLSNYTLIIIERFAAQQPKKSFPCFCCTFSIILSLALFIYYSQEKRTRPPTKKILFLLHSAELQRNSKKRINDKTISKINVWYLTNTIFPYFCVSINS